MFRPAVLPSPQRHEFMMRCFINSQVCIFLLALAAYADDSLEEKKVDKRGLLGLGYGFGHSLSYVPAVSYTKVSDRQFAVQDTGERRGWRADAGGIVYRSVRRSAHSYKSDFLSTRFYTRGNCDKQAEH